MSTQIEVTYGCGHSQMEWTKNPEAARERASKDKCGACYKAIHAQEDRDAAFWRMVRENNGVVSGDTIAVKVSSSTGPDAEATDKAQKWGAENIFDSKPVEREYWEVTEAGERVAVAKGAQIKRGDKTEIYKRGYGA